MTSPGWGQCLHGKVGYCGECGNIPENPEDRIQELEHENQLLKQTWMPGWMVDRLVRGNEELRTTLHQLSKDRNEAVERWLKDGEHALGRAISAETERDQLVHQLYLLRGVVKGYQRALGKAALEIATHLSPEDGPDDADGMWSPGWEFRFGYVNQEHVDKLMSEEKK